MNIYNIGIEKCVDGVWGREVQGRLYTHYVASAVQVEDALHLCRRLSIDSEDSFWALRGSVTSSTSKYEDVGIESLSCPRKVQYTPKHIKDLENLKRGDIVWVLNKTDRGDEWTSTRFVYKVGENYTTSNLFMPCGHVLCHWKQSHEEVFLKPPFDF